MNEPIHTIPCILLEMTEFNELNKRVQKAEEEAFEVGCRLVGAEHVLKKYAESDEHGAQARMYFKYYRRKEGNE